MHRAVVAILLLISTLTSRAEESIQELSLPTIKALGKELYQRDQVASAATDVLLAAKPEARSVPVRGWITHSENDVQRVYFIQERDSKISLAYSVTFHEKTAPKIEDHKGADLPEPVARRFTARQAALAAIPKFMTKKYNFEVLDAPTGGGFIVYALAATQNPSEVVVGGHYRVTVAADGKVQQVDALSRSFLVLQKQNPEADKDKEVVGITMSHVVSSTPVETHVFLSLLHKTPLYVLTPDKVIWKVSEGDILKIGHAD